MMLALIAALFLTSQAPASAYFTCPYEAEVESVKSPWTKTKVVRERPVKDAPEFVTYTTTLILKNLKPLFPKDRYGCPTNTGTEFIVQSSSVEKLVVRPGLKILFTHYRGSDRGTGSWSYFMIDSLSEKSR